METVDNRGMLPRVQWSPVIAGVLCALAVHIVLGLFGSALGFTAARTDSEGIGAGAAIWGVLVPFVASFIGAMICVRLAGMSDKRGAWLHGALVWCVGLIAGAIFITGSMWAGGFTASQSPTARGEAFDTRNRIEASELAAGTAAAGGLAAVFGLIGAFAGAAMARKNLMGERVLPSVRFESPRRAYTAPTNERVRSYDGKGYGTERTSEIPRTTSVPRDYPNPRDDLHH